MATMALSCNNCGAPLEVPEQTKFLTCAHCGSRLQIGRSGSAVYTELVEQVEAVARSAQEIAADVEEIRLHHRLEALDREWQQEQRSFMLRTRRGGERLPTEVGPLGVVPIVIGVLWTILATAMTQQAPDDGPVVKVFFPLVGVAAIIGGIYSLVTISKKAEAYRGAEERYRQRRQALQRQIEV